MPTELARDFRNSLDLNHDTDTACLPTQFHFTSWNIHRGERRNWQSLLRDLNEKSAVVALQEAVDSTPFKDVMGSHSNWSFSPGSRLQGRQTGVLNASRVKPLDHCKLQHMEPWIGLPKATVVSMYPLADGQTIMIANTHSINFTPGVRAYQRQLTDLATVVSQHDGPLIVAGDFNTWSRERKHSLAALTEALSLKSVEYGLDRRKRYRGKPLDHIFVRGLRSGLAHAPRTRTSDHSPITVSLSVESEHQNNESVSAPRALKLV